MKLLLSLLIFISFTAFSQKTIDSIRLVWKKENLSQKEMMREIHELLIGNTEALSISWELAVEYNNLAKKSGDDYHLGNSYGHMGIMKLELAEFDQARKYLTQSLAFAKTTKNTNLILQNHAALTSINITEGDFETAADFQLMSWDLIKNSTNSFQKARALGNFGVIQLLLKDYKKSFSYTSLALQMFKKDKDTAAMIISYTNLGELYYEQSKYDSAYVYQDSALNIILRDVNKESFYYLNTLSICYSSLSLTCFHLGKEELLNKYAMKALNLCRRTENKVIEAETLFTMSLVAKGDSTLLLVKQALIIADEVNSAMLISRFSYQLYLFYRERNQNAEALNMYELYNLATEAITDDEALKKIEAYEYKEQREYSKNEYEEDLEKKETENRNYFSIILGISTVSILSLLFLWRIQFRLKRTRNDLLAQIEVFKKEETSGKRFQDILVQKTVEIDRVVIENYIEANLNESDWAIMKALYDNPAISNKVLADQISLSVEGAKSSLKKMYSLFEIPLSRNMKLALILKVINLTTI